MTAYGIDYAPIAGDNTAALNATILSAASAGQTLFIQPGLCGIAGSIFLPSGARIRGYSQSATTIQKISGSPVANMIVNAAAFSDVMISDLTIDGNSANQSGAFFPLGLSSVSRLTIERIKIVNPWGTAFWINGPDPGVPPDGAQINFDVTIRDCIIDGTAQRDRSADMTVLGRINRLLFSNNYLTGAGANMLALQFLNKWNVEYNHLTKFWRGIYIESSQFGGLFRNDLDTLGTPAPAIGDARAVGIWATSANESYPGVGYNGCRWIDISHNTISNLVRSTGSTGLAAIVVSGLGGSNYAVNNRVERNIIAGGYTQANNGYGIVVEGAHDGTTVDGNSIWAFNGAIVATGTYGGVSAMSDVSVKDNVAESCNVFGLSASGTTHTNFSSIGNRMSNNASPGGYSGGITGTTGFLSANNQGF